ncbi:MarR family winged helix-turn-helix transcriptional regulator [Sinanaerobacter sp. ZZT-01]|uniref:MarR family winged helix-turn-helix transcriptional regulator n=1 Tax=Sinanaerobacter sp. ZZT-01 TaxID=3111540 RepID=UPI002D79F6AD|nr:MarR family transcriptional regulator [Sinanaerobacter sp. ZZT-01]WRR92092.1 MarR family transcriptional regulator [Sinanaerobacter sp. ZZT-01]
MDLFSRELNGLLADTFRSILKIEEQAVRNSEQSDLSINELHLLEAVAKDKDKGRTISDIALDMNITLPSVTVAINKLAKKGYVEKIKSENDGRRVFVKLTRLGHKVNAGHQYFHENMVRNVAAGMTEEEKEILVRGITKLNEFFKKRLEARNKK